MSEVTQILKAIETGDPHGAANLLPLVYNELRTLAEAKMANERPDHTLDATALVNEAYLRLAGNHSFSDRMHFFRVAAEAMRRILVDPVPSRQAGLSGKAGSVYNLKPEYPYCAALRGGRVDSARARTRCDSSSEF
jgi:RNA polymerase sigma factor (TIGR02999 family)